MKTFRVTYTDEIVAESLEAAYARLLVVLASDVEHNDADAFVFEEVLEVDNA